MPINDPEKSENMRKSIRVYSGSSNRPLAQKIAEYLGVELSGLTLKQFANGEIYARYDETVRGADVFLIQSVAGGNVNDMLMELLIATDAAKRASARSITAVITHYGYARQDRKAGPREYTCSSKKHNVVMLIDQFLQFHDFFIHDHPSCTVTLSTDAASLLALPAFSPLPSSSALTLFPCTTNRVDSFPVQVDTAQAP